MKNTSGSDAVLGCMVIVLMFTVSPIVNGFVLSQLWAWFVAAKFHAPLLTIPEAIGLSLVASWLLSGKANDKWDKETPSALDIFIWWFVRTFLVAGFVLVMGAVVVRFV